MIKECYVKKSRFDIRRKLSKKNEQRTTLASSPANEDLKLKGSTEKIKNQWEGPIPILTYSHRPKKTPKKLVPQSL